MSKRIKKEEEHENHERWLVSYADFITLLFTFFAALYALSSLDKAKADKISGSLRQAFKVIEEPIMIHEEKTKALIDDIRDKIKDANGISAKTEPRGVVVTFADGVLFDSGSAEIKKEATALLDKLPAALNSAPGKILIEGHTDNVPLSGGKYASNWELSTARASSILNFFITKGLDPNRFSIAGYAEYRPVAINNTDENRAKNRRVELIISK
ncbi:MAG: chemotaxis protein MotB [Nitrospirae bacterium]|nr:MAG: chemotaxis protein MotB [Nitrospirota bacterium]